METKDGRGVYKDLRGRVTLEANSNMRCEFIEGQRHGDKETLAKEASDLLDVDNGWAPLGVTGPVENKSKHFDYGAVDCGAVFGEGHEALLRTRANFR